MSDGPGSPSRGGSPSLAVPDLWWYQARARLLRVTFDPLLGTGAQRPLRALDVGSADGPSSYWAGRDAHVVSIDPDPRGLRPGGVCAALPHLPFADASVDVVTAFDVIEHCADDVEALREVRRVLRPGGRLFMSVPAYQWAWTDFDVHNGHYRRYTRARAVAAVEAAGLEVLRATHAFATVFPAFTAQRLAARVRERRAAHSRAVGPADIVPALRAPSLVERSLLAMCRVDEALLARHDLAFGSSVLLAASRGDLPEPGSDSRESEATT